MAPSMYAPGLTVVLAPTPAPDSVPANDGASSAAATWVPLGGAVRVPVADGGAAGWPGAAEMAQPGLPALEPHRMRQSRGVYPSVRFCRSGEVEKEYRVLCTQYPVRAAGRELVGAVPPHCHGYCVLSTRYSRLAVADPA